MADSEKSILTTIAELVAKIDERMKPIIDDKRLVNKLCEHAKLPPRYADVDTEAARGSLTIRRDQYHGKPLATAVREYLMQRGPSDRGGLGAASVNEIFEALISGGYQPETDDETNAKRGLRIALTKNSSTFYRVPGRDSSAGAYGLLEWYPNAKPQDDNKPRGSKRKRGRKSSKQLKAKAENVVDLKSSEKSSAGKTKDQASSERDGHRAA